MFTVNWKVLQPLQLPENASGCPWYTFLHSVECSGDEIPIGVYRTILWSKVKMLHECSATPASVHPVTAPATSHPCIQPSGHPAIRASSIQHPASRQAISPCHQCSLCAGPARGSEVTRCTLQHYTWPGLVQCSSNVRDAVHGRPSAVQCHCHNSSLNYIGIIFIATVTDTGYWREQMFANIKTILKFHSNKTMS